MKKVIIPSVLGITVDLSKGVISGRVYDCGLNNVEGGRVRVVDDSTGQEAEGVIVRYFVDDFPDRDQLWTSQDGLFVNHYLVDAGAAVAKTYEPNSFHAEILHDAERQARAANRGLWQVCGGPDQPLQS